MAAMSSVQRMCLTEWPGQSFISTQSCHSQKRHLVRLVWLHDEGVARSAPLFHAAHDHHKAICGGLRANVDARILSSQQVLDESCLSCTIACTL